MNDKIATAFLITLAGAVISGILYIAFVPIPEGPAMNSKEAAEAGRIRATVAWRSRYATAAPIATSDASPIVERVRPSPNAHSSETLLGAESVKSYELGFKLTSLGGKMRLNGAAYYTDYKDLQLLVAGIHPKVAQERLVLARIELDSHSLM
jgi:hypothetical protein